MFAKFNTVQKINNLWTSVGPVWEIETTLQEIKLFQYFR